MSSKRYKIIKDFPKQGGMSLTSLAIDNNLNRKVVIKRLNICNKKNEEIKKLNNQLKEEAKNQANLTHHNIAKVYDYYEEDNMGHIVMEYVEGKAISEIPEFNKVKEDKKSLEKALNVISQIIEGVNYAHKNSIVHRDIKTDNIMYNPDTNNVKIIDFGLSKIKEQEQRDGTVVFWGTKGYIPKEVFDLYKGKREKIDEVKRDIFSLGVTIYIILTGQFPYGESEDDFMKLAPRISDFREDINEELNEIFYSMIQVQPEDRLSDLTIVLEAIRRQLRQGNVPLIKIPKFHTHIKIRDAIHGYISLTKDESKIVDNRFFQRLRNIKQLGTTYLVYPCAMHSRFEHSLGVMHVATRIFDEIVSKYNNILGWDREEIKKQRQMLRLLALLHDIGHAPFSHVSDDLFSNEIKNHESMGAKIIRESELKNLIDEIAKKNGDFSSNEIAGLIEGKYLSKYNLIKQIFSGSVIDADRMDYLLRDSYMAGVKYGTYDLEHLIRSIDIDTNFEEPILALDYKGIYVLEEFILARYYMFNQVYYHKTRRVYDKILENCIRNCLRANEISRLPSDIDKFIEYDDHKIMSYIKNYPSDMWNNMFLRRKHYKQVFEIFPVANDNDKKVVSKIKQNIKESDIHQDKIIIDEYSKPPIIYKDEEGNPMFGLIGKYGKPLYIDEESHVLRNMNEATYIFRIYVDENYKDKVLKIIKEVKKC